MEQEQVITTQPKPSRVSRLFGRYIIKNRIQFKFSLMVFAFLAVSSLTMWFETDLVINHLIEAEVITGTEAIESLEALSRINFLTSVLALSVVFGLSLFFSHFIAGPIYRMEKTFDQLRGGDLSVEIRLRKHDELQDTAQMLNFAISSLRRKTKHDRDQVSEHVRKISKFAESLKKSGKMEEAAQLEHLIFDLQNITPQIKI